MIGLISDSLLGFIFLKNILFKSVTGPAVSDPVGHLRVWGLEFRVYCCCYLRNLN